MRSCLEIYSMDGSSTMPYGRHQQEIRSDYQRTNEYSATHPDALAPKWSEGKGKVHEGPGHRYTMGKGTGISPREDWLPNCKGQLGQYINGFDTTISSGAGNEEDNNARNIALTRSLYSHERPYGDIDTTLNRQEGQFTLK